MCNNKNKHSGGVSCSACNTFFHFIFLSLQFSNIKFFDTLLSGTVRPRRLKLGTHEDSGQMYRLYRNQAATTFSSFYFFIFLSNFQTLKLFITLFFGTVRPRRLKLGDSGQMYHIYRNPAAAAAYSFLYFFNFLSNFQTLKIFVTLFSETVRPRRLKLYTHMDNEYQNQAACVFVQLFLAHLSRRLTR